MRLSTSTNLFGENRNKIPVPYTDTVECLRRCKAAGFDVVDMNFCPMRRGLTNFVRDDWMESLSRVKEAADELGLTFSQSHLPIYPDLNAGPLESDPAFYPLFMEYTRRAVIGSGTLGVKWAVAHPYTDTRNSQYDNAASLKMNLDFYRPIVELAKENGVGIAFENMLENQQPAVKRRFCSVADELIHLVDAFNDPAVGVCWDFGHGNTVYADQELALRMIGKRLKATHVAENKGAYDSHTAPFVEGSVNWEKLMPLLTEIGYEGDLTFEIQSMTNHLPDLFKDKVARFCFHIGQYCLSLAEEGGRRS